MKVSKVKESLVTSRRNFLRFSALCFFPTLLISEITKSQAEGLSNTVSSASKRAVINVRDMGALGNKQHDDTAAFQNSVDNLPESGGTIIVPPGDYMIDASRSVRLRNRTRMKLEPGARLLTIPNALKRSYVLLVENISDVEIAGGQIIGDRDTHLGTLGEWGYGIFIRSAERVSVHDIHISNCWGDGICVGAVVKNSKVTKMSDGITLRRVVSTNNRRQGLSIGPARNVIVEDSEFSNTHGTKPSCGVDIEPEKRFRAENIKFSRCRFIGNSGSGLQIDESVYQVKVENCVINDNFRYGVFIIGGAGCDIHNNMLSGNGLVGTRIMRDSNNCRIENNTFKDNSTRAAVDVFDKVIGGNKSLQRKTSDLDVAADAKGIVFINNIFSGHN